MAIKHNRASGRCYLSQWRTYRRDGKVVSEYVRYLGPCSEHNPGPHTSVLDRLTHGPSRRAGAVRLLWKLAQDLQFIPTIDTICGWDSRPGTPSPGQYLTCWAINRVLDPDSATQLGPWVATTDLPALAGFPDPVFNKDAFLYALDFVVHDEPEVAAEVDHTRELDTALSHHWREEHPLPKGERETVAYDLTSVLFFGVTCEIAEKGHNPDHQARPQVNVGVVVSRHDRAPLLHFTYRGSRNGSGTSRNVLVELQRAGIPPGLIIVDRGIANERMATEARGMGWHLLGGLSKQLKEVRTILRETEVPRTPSAYVRGTRQGSIYAVKVRAQLWKEEREVVMYTNAERAQRDEEERNRELAAIGKALTALSEKGKDWREAKLHAAIGAIVGSWKDLVQVRVQRGGKTPRILWEYRERGLKVAAREDGKYVLFCTDEGMPAEMVVEEYLGKDFVEKVFRTLKTPVELEPVRHRRERRVRAYLFVCMLAYRLISALRWRLVEAGVKEKTAEYQERLVEELSRVERTEVVLGGQRRMWYLNKSDFIVEALRKLGLKDLLKEGPPEGASPSASIPDRPALPPGSPAP
ncbi:MAG: IS1634 family transposase [Thermoplasmata archaeon]